MSDMRMRAPQPRTVHLVEVELKRVDVADAAAVLDGDERARADAFLRPADRTRFVAAHVAFRGIVGAFLGIAPGEVQIARSCLHCGDPTHGKPRVAAGGAESGCAPALDVSLSHAGDVALVAVAAAPMRVGVDVERERPDLDWGEILGAPCPDPRVGLLRWTRSEAVVKAAGLGLVVRPEVDGTADWDGWRRASVPGTDGPWFVRDVPCEIGPAYAAAVSTDIPGVGVRCSTWPDIVL